MEVVETTSPPTRHRVVPRRSSRATTSPSGVTDPSVSRYSTVERVAVREAHQPVARVDAHLRFPHAARRRLAKVEHRPDRAVEELVLVDGEAVGATRPQDSGPCAGGERRVDPVARDSADALEDRSCGRLLHAVRARPDRVEDRGVVREDDEGQSDRVATRNEQERRARARRPARTRAPRPTRGTRDPVPTTTAAA